MATLKLAASDVLGTVVQSARVVTNSIGMLDDVVTGCRHYTRDWQETTALELAQNRQEMLAAVAQERKLSIAQRQLAIGKQLQADPELAKLFAALA